jgi:hypothetical protein
MILDNNHKKSINKADIDSIEEIIGSNILQFKKNIWLDKKNHYYNNCTKKLDNERNKIKKKDLSKYIAVSAFLHCYDGWRYQSKAINSILNGDLYTACHLGYYAELRAAMSLLASFGIGIFNYNHYIVNASGNAERIPIKNTGTHKIIWPILEYYSTNKKFISILLDIITINNITLNEFLNAYDISYKKKIITKNFIENWGIDLKQISIDRYARNETSYRPTGLKKFYDNKKNISFICDFWELLDPRSSSSFEKIDHYLLRESIESIFKNDQPRGPNVAHKQFDKKIKNMIFKVKLNSYQQEFLIKFLKRELYPDNHKVLSESNKKMNVNNPKTYYQIISRGLFLLRISTGLCERFLKKNSIDSEILHFWKKNILISNGIFNLSEYSGKIDYQDLYEDVNTAINEIIDWKNNNGSIYDNFAKFHADNSYSIKTLSDSQKVYVWSL